MRLFLFAALLCAAVLACNAPAAEPSAADAAAAAEPLPPLIVAPAESPDIRIQVEGLAPGLVNLIGVFEEQNYRADSALADASGLVVFKRSEPYRRGYFVLATPSGSLALQMLIDADQTFSIKTKTLNLVGAAKVEGSLDNELLYQSLNFEQAMMPKFEAAASAVAAAPLGSPQHKQAKAQQDQLVAERMAYLQDIFQKNPESFFTQFKRAGQNPVFPQPLKPDGSLDTARWAYLYRTKLWDGVDFRDERLLNTPVIATKLKRYIKELTPQNPDSILASAYRLVDKVLDQKPYFKYFANWIVLSYDPKESKLMDAQAVYANMIQKYFTYDKAFWSDSAEIHALQLRAYEMAASLVGKKGPDVVSKDPSGKTRSIYEIKAPYIIVYMYNPDCEHCAVQTPLLVQFYKEWKSKGVEVFAIAIDTDAAKWKAYLAKNGMPWINVHDPTNKSIYAKYFVDVTPEIYVLNPERTLIAKNLQVDQIATVLERDMRKQR